MIITDAFWEKRNLGVSTAEIEVDAEDSTESLQETLRTLDAEYQVVKIPTCRMDLYFALQGMGFSFAEASIRVSHEIGELMLSPLMERLCRKIDFEEMRDFDFLNSNIKKQMFTTDRVSLDPFFSEEQAAERYIGWMKDERDRGSIVFNYIYKETAIGFSCMRGNEKGEYYPVLGGLYPNDKPIPLGTAILYKQLEIVRSLGGNSLYTYISSNNLPVFKAYSRCGYSFDDIHYVFVRHFGESGDPLKR